MRRSKQPTAKQAAKFERDATKIVAALVERLGGRATCKADKFGTMYKFVIPTSLGPLLLSPYDTWVACRFEDVDTASDRLGGGSYSRLNSYSGKWNWHAGWGTKGSETWANMVAVLFQMEREITEIRLDPLEILSQALSEETAA